MIKWRSGRKRLFGGNWSVSSRVGIPPSPRWWMASRSGGDYLWETQVCTPLLGLALLLPGVRSGCSIIGLLFLPHSLLPPGGLSHLKAWSTRASPEEYTTLFFQKLTLAHILGCRFCVLLYKHLDDIAREGVDFEQIEPSYLFQKKTYFIIIRWLKNWKWWEANGIKPWLMHNIIIYSKFRSIKYCAARKPKIK